MSRRLEFKLLKIEDCSTKRMFSYTFLISICEIWPHFLSGLSRHKSHQPTTTSEEDSLDLEAAGPRAIPCENNNAVTKMVQKKQHVPPGPPSVKAASSAE